MASEIPTSRARIASRLSVSVSTATTPAARAASIQPCSASSVVTVSYGPNPLPFPVAGATCTGASANRFPCPARTAAGGATNALAEAPASIPNRDAKLRNPCAASHGPRTSRSGSRATSASIGSGNGTSHANSTSRRDTRANSACSINRSRRLLGFIPGAAANIPSRSPNSWISCAAVLGPMPGTPGTLSTLSPISACASISFSGPTPNFSITSASPIGFCFIGSSISMPGRSNCIRSLSEETIVARPPCATTAQA